MQHQLVGKGILVPTQTRLLDNLLWDVGRHCVHENSGPQANGPPPVANHREGVNRMFRDCPSLVLRLRTFPTLEIYLQPLAPIYFLDPDHRVRHSQERQCHPAVGLFSNVRVHRKMLA